MKTKAKSKSAPKTRKRKADDLEQYERFREFARKVEADDDLEAFDDRFRKILRKPSSKES
jgi:hypothetical protein